MPELKYFDFTNNRPLNLESDGCDLSEWKGLHGASRFARHPKGFKIFLAPDRLAACDEYEDSDPYSVVQNLENDFQRTRTDLTIELLRKAVSLVQGTPTILDLGCGQGHITQAMHRALDTADVAGLDYSVSAIEYAHEHFPGIDFSVGDAYDAPYSKEYFDVIVCNNLWEHVPDPLRLLGRTATLLKPGGYIIVSTPSRYRLGNLVKTLRGKPVAFMSNHHVTEYTVGQVIEQLAYGGFQAEAIVSRPVIVTLKHRVVRMLQRPLEWWVSLVGSHHTFGYTVFYLAKKS